MMLASSLFFIVKVSMKSFIRFLLIVVSCSQIDSVLAQVDTIQKVVSGRTNSAEQQKKPYVILVSADGFRHDYAEKYEAKNLNALSAQGVRAKSMIPSYPSVTFPNHYTIATGLYPSHHGLVNNSFFDDTKKASYSMSNQRAVRDGSWYGGTPLWVLAEQQKMISASFYWVGSEADIKGTLPTYNYNYNTAISNPRRIQVVKEWLNLPENIRPHLITFYFNEPDHEGHTHGPDAEKTKEAVHSIDSAMKALNDVVKSTGLPVNIIFLSDHGMTAVDTLNTLPRPAAIDTSKFFVSGDGLMVYLTAKDRSNRPEIVSMYKKVTKEAVGYKVYLKTKMPGRMHYSAKDDVKNRIGDIVLVTEWPNVFNLYGRKPSPGMHGYDPYLVKDMHATFYAWGPHIKEGIEIPAFKNVDVYPIVTEILGLSYTENIDGTKKVATKILKK
jgi:predicted AlkP superfamily pyrophosphatase or phosphodiesterase